MVELDFNTILDKLVKGTKLSEKELLARINKKIDELSGLVSKRGAAHVIATELGVKISPPVVKQFIELNKLMPGLSNITVVGRVTNLSPVREFDKNGRKGKVSNILLSDGSASTRLVFWNDHTRIISSSRINLNDIIRVHHVNSKQGLYGIELHFTPRSRIELNPEEVKLPDQKTTITSRLNICDLQEGMEVSINGCAVQLIKRNPLYEVCPECKKRLTNGQCAMHSFSKPGHSMVVNAVFDDGTGTVSCVFFSNNAESLINSPVSKTESQISEQGVEDFIKLKSIELLGTELLISGRVVHNNFSDRTELIVKNFQKTNPVTEAKRFL